MGSQQCTGLPCLPSWGLLLRSWSPGRPYPFLSQPSEEEGFSNPGSPVPEGKVQPLGETHMGLRTTAENQVPQSSSNPKGHHLPDWVVCILLPAIMLWASFKGSKLALGIEWTQNTQDRKEESSGNSPQLSWEQLDVSSRRWSVAISVICSPTKRIRQLTFVWECSKMIAWGNARITFPPRQFLFEEPLTCGVSDAYKHLLKCSSLRG